MVRRCTDILVIDWVAALVPRAEIDGEMGDSYWDYKHVLCHAIRKLAGIVIKTNCSVIFINQLRDYVMFGN